MSHAQPSKIGTTRTITTDARARREDRQQRNRRRDAVYSNELRAALRDAAPLLSVHRIF
ncbi:hypothetical protein Drose_05825 [Dactylosporangium roseum]|uniref:BHLH domain-containing protein n=1 Tax=Dactylosporangium roseum TaxID=47989 RepID=A0ABY5Z814_9ACTN|nr:hypothetical protein [Dactylosporangium roseum]UWZ37789.1 hypothetical protein Drose_05825 [Dactylosporangium roseum]